MKDLIGESIRAIEKFDDQRVIVRLRTGWQSFIFFHDQDCCELVELREANMDGIIGKVICAVSAEVDHNLPEGAEQMESFTNTTFTFKTEDGSVGTLRFLGQSNGYYSESVEFAEESK